MADYSFHVDGLPKQVNLSVVKLGENSLGSAFELKIDYKEDFQGRDYYGWDRFWLGYFFVTKNKIYLIRENHFKNIIEDLETEEELLDIGAIIVCQDTNKEDVLENEDKGFHETIRIEGEICEYSSYNNLTETGFYEKFLWKQEVGLLEYRSGFGAENDQIILKFDFQTNSTFVNPTLMMFFSKHIDVFQLYLQQWKYK